MRNQSAFSVASADYYYPLINEMTHSEEVPFIYDNYSIFLLDINVFLKKKKDE
jgi:hypothetical protein